MGDHDGHTDRVKNMRAWKDSKVAKKDSQFMNDKKLKIYIHLLCSTNAAQTSEQTALTTNAITIG